MAATQTSGSIPISSPASERRIATRSFPLQSSGRPLPFRSSSRAGPVTLQSASVPGSRPGPSPASARVRTAMSSIRTAAIPVTWPHWQASPMLSGSVVATPPESSCMGLGAKGQLSPKSETPSPSVSCANEASGRISARSSPAAARRAEARRSLIACTPRRSVSAIPRCERIFMAAPKPPVPSPV